MHNIRNSLFPYFLLNCYLYKSYITNFILIISCYITTGLQRASLVPSPVDALLHDVIIYIDRGRIFFFFFWGEGGVNASSGSGTIRLDKRFSGVGTVQKVGGG